MKSLRRHRRKSIPTVSDCLADLWAHACAAEGIDPEAKFAVFSTNNAPARAYNAVVAKLAYNAKERHATR